MYSFKAFSTGICAKLLILLSLLAFSISAKASCTYKINQASQWYFSSTVTITNTGAAAVSGWDVTFDFVDGTTPNGGYTNGNYSLSFAGSGPYTVTAVGGYATTLSPGSSINLTIQGNGGTAVLASLTGSLCGPAGPVVPLNQSLTIVKEIINDHSGNSVATDFGITSSAGTINFDPPTGTGTASDPLVYRSTPISVPTGTYSLIESNVVGYTAGTWSCTGAAGKVLGTFDAGRVQVGKDENVICTIVNNDDEGARSASCEHSIKSYNGGFSGKIKVTNTGVLPISGWDVDWSYMDGSTLQNSYNVVLTGSNPYNGANVVYNGNIGVGGSVTFGFNGKGGGALGSLTSSLCEPFVASQTLTVEKIVINDDGGTAVVSDFNVTTDAGTLTFDAGTTTGTTTTYQSAAIPVNPGTYSLSEDDHGAYTEGSWVCADATGPVIDIFNSGSVKILSGENITCTIKNDDTVPLPANLNIDLAIRKGASNTSPNVGDTITFTLKVTNHGPDNATNVIIEDTINTGFAFVANSMTGGDFRNQTAPDLSWTINTLPAGGANVQLLNYQVTVVAP